MTDRSDIKLDFPGNLCRVAFTIRFLSYISIVFFVDLEFHLTEARDDADVAKSLSGTR